MTRRQEDMPKRVKRMSEREIDEVMVRLMRRAHWSEKYIYAWRKCGYFPPDIVDSARSLVGAPPLPAQLTAEEIKQWKDAVREFEEKERGRR
jgi:hypothetical protein